MRFALLSMALIAGLAAPSLAQRQVRLPQGAPVAVALAHGVSAKSARVGDRVILRVARAVEFAGATVIPEGALVEGEVDAASDSGTMGRPGSVTIVAREVILEEDGRIALDGVLTRSGADNRPSAGAGMVNIPLGRSGQNTNLKAGTVFIATTARDF